MVVEDPRGPPRRRRRRKELLPQQCALLALFCVTLGVYKLVTPDEPAEADYADGPFADPMDSSPTGRYLLQFGVDVDDVAEALPVCNFRVDSEFQPRGALVGQRWIGVHLVLMFYMFLGLAIVCDDFFEASLSQICESLELKEDVAGATFMAAGGSAPELATSIMGVFVAKSDVGFGTIVGSAIFNVLFVIAACSFVAPNLPLTWWPLVRDSVFYCVSIALIVGFILDQEVSWWEALALLIMYGLYIVVMYFNERLDLWVRSRLDEAVKPKPPHRAALIRFVESSPFVYGIMAVIVLNIFVIIFANAFDSPTLFAINIACACVFIVEILVKIYAYGFFACWLDPMNVFDGLLVLLIIAEFGFSQGSSGNISGLRILRFIRLARVLRLARFYRIFAKRYRNEATQVEDGDWVREPTGPIPVQVQEEMRRARASRASYSSVDLEGDVRPGSKRRTPARVAPAAGAGAEALPHVSSNLSSDRGGSSVKDGSGLAHKPYSFNHKPSATKAVRQLSKSQQPSWRKPTSNSSDRSMDAAAADAARASGDGYRETGESAATASGAAAPGSTPPPRGDAASRAAAAFEEHQGAEDAGARQAQRRSSSRDGGGRDGVDRLSASNIAGATMVEEVDEPGDGAEGEEDSDDGPDDPANPFEVPESWLGRVFWAIAFPLLFVMWATIPDCRRPVFKKYFFLTFVMSIVWIALFSYVMVWMATLFGIAANIPAPVMGLTILAAGTSIPDCLSSMAVARKGHGDMAVSSSIGSNIFDILVGLPVPWFIYTAIVNPGETVTIQSQGLGIMIVLLFLMVAAVIIIIHLSGWLLLKRVGYAMMTLYVIFLAFSLLLEYQVIPQFRTCILPWEA